MNRIIRLLAFLLVTTNVAFAQNNTGSIYGTITDEKGQPLDFASIQVFQGGVSKGGKKTDLNGNYEVKPLQPGKYTVKITFAGYTTQEIEGVNVGIDGRTKVNAQMEKTVKKIGKTDDGVVKVAYRNPIISDGRPVKAMGKDEIKQSATINTTDMAAMTGGAVQRKAGDGGLSLGGDRTGGTQYMIDGILVRGSRAVNMPIGSVENIEVITNGLPAKYGNGTGGLVNITTSSVARKLSGDFAVQHSVEGYNNNLASLNLSGPLLRINKTNLSGVKEKKPVIGFVLSVQAKYDKDNNPYIQKYYRVKPEILKNLQEQPLMLMPNATGSALLVPRAQSLTANDFEKIKARENGQVNSLQFMGKLDFQLAENVNLTVGSQAEYSNSHSFSFANSLYSPEANVITKSFTGRGYARLTHRIGKPSSQEKQGEKKSAIQDAYYTLQFSYQKSFDDQSNPLHGHDIFKYGYLGKFINHDRKYYTLDTALRQDLQAQKYVGSFPDSITFIPAGFNPIMENYTKQVYENFPAWQLRDLLTIQNRGGLRNGDGPPSVYSMWTGIGAQAGSWGKSMTDQATLNLDAAFSVLQGLKNKSNTDPIVHNIQFGIGYDQRVSRGYSIGSPWSLMRLLVNRHIQNLDLSNPMFIVGGQDMTQQVLNGSVILSNFDTISYNPLYVANDQARIDKELRKALGLQGGELNLTDINIDALDPSTFKPEMFSPTDLMNNGNDIVSYFGYDAYGNKLSKQPSFNDFWTKKDARGDYARSIGAFRPIYMYGYILDKFNYKNINFNLGVRIDRYDANQKTLKDPYSLYATRKVGDIKEGSYNVAKDPSDANSVAPPVTNFDKDYVVYVNNNSSSKPTVVGYRKGDVWFDPWGKEISDPTILSSLYADGLPIQPYLQNAKDSIKSASFNPNGSFEDFKPQVTLSPRFNFSFPISGKAIFYGNYDVITQTPSSNNFVTPDDYYYLAERQSTINNANLRMEKGINYSFGYQQKLSERAALTLEAYYRERKNQIQLQQYLLAYPITYQSFGNRDFSSTKGFTAKLDFRRKGPIRMDINYTLQFAEGTGSNAGSQASLLSTSQPNLRTVFPLDFDSRHIINGTFDYRYEGDNLGPKIGKKHPFQNMGLNLQLRSRSGEPYTKSSISNPIVGGDFLSTPIVGTVNGSRLPWNYEISARLDKTFIINPTKKSKDGAKVKSKSPLEINVYTYVTNLTNKRNTLSVYRYTGSGSDDGYLTSDQGIQRVSLLQYSQAFSDQYRYRIFSPGNFNNPRMIFVGFSLGF